MCRISLLAASLIIFNGVPAQATIDTPVATTIFAEAKAICTRDGGRMWGTWLCAPILIVDYKDRTVIANQPDAKGKLRKQGDFYIGTLPDEVVIADTPTDWAGIRWTQLVVPQTADVHQMRVLLAHEMFHRIQTGLGLSRPEITNRHLDTLEARYLIQLEWRALSAALQARDAEARRAAVTDAIAFRRERYRLFPDAMRSEAALEVGEGVPEYVGVTLGLQTDKDRLDYALRDMRTILDAPTFVRSFAYATGPAYGLLLDLSDRRWSRRAGEGKRFDEMLATDLKLTVVPRDITPRAARYDDGSLRESEERRNAERLARLAAYKAKLIDGPVLILPLGSTNFQFNPRTLVPLEGFGTVYPTMRLTDAWGSLEVEEGGALIMSEKSQATVSACGIGADRITGGGWKMTLKPGWSVVTGPRPGDLLLKCAGCPK